MTSFGYIPVRIDFENIEVREGATILAAIFNNLLGIISRPLAFFSSIFEKMLETIISDLKETWTAAKKTSTGSHDSRSQHNLHNDLAVHVTSRR